MNLDDAVKIADLFNKLVGAIVPIFVLIFGLREYNKWRRELIGRNQIELAQRIGRLAEEFRLQFRHVINATTYSSEYNDRPRSQDRKGFESLLDEKYARQKRIEGLFTILGKLSEANVEAEIIFDKNLDEFLNPCVKLAYELNEALNQFVRLQIQYGIPSNEFENPDIEEARKTVYGINKKPLEEVTEATTKMKKYAKSFLKS
jgi:hypothetical protein